MNPIPYGKHNITQDDIDAVVEVLKSDSLTQGPKITEFEERFSKYVSAKYAVAVSNGTAALHLSALSLIKPGDKVLTTPITFAATANCILYCRGEVDFVDIDPETYLIDLNKLEDKLHSVPKRTYKGIIPVDFAGNPVNMEQFRQLARQYDLWIIEDASHAPGGYFTDSNNQHQYCGNGNYAELAIFSFHSVKHIAAGEGGIITTNNEILYQKLKLLRTHGITKNPLLLLENHGDWYYEMHELGYNYRLSDIQAALGINQLKRADDGIKRRREIAQKYKKAFTGYPIKTPVDSGYHAYHLYIIQMDDRTGIYNSLRQNNIFTQIHYIPVHLMPWYKQLGWEKGDFPVAEKYYKHCLSLPMYPTLTDEEQEYVINKILKFIS